MITKSLSNQTLKVAFIFLIVSFLLGIFSGELLLNIYENNDIITQFQNNKEWLYLLTVSFIIYFLIKRENNRIQLLEESEERYKQLSKLNHEGVVIHKNGIILDVNKAFCDIFEYDAKELLGLTVVDILLTPESAKKAWNQISSKKPDPIFLQGKKKNGQLIHVEIQGKNTIFNRQKARVVTIRDLTEKIESAEKIMEEKTRSKNILEGTNAGSWEWLVQTNEVFVSERWAEIIGYKLEELQPIKLKYWVNSVHPDDLEAANIEIKKVLSKEIDYYDVEFRQKHKNGDWVWVNARGKVVDWTEDGKPRRMSGVHIDITSRKNTENTLIESEERFRTHYNNMPIPAYTWQQKDNDFILIEYNTAAEKITKGLIKDVLHTKLSDYYKDRKDIITDITACYKSKKIIQKEMLYEFLTGKEKIFAVTYVFVLPNNVIVHTKDITKQKKAEIKIKESEEKYRSLFRNMTSGFAVHEMIYDDNKNPINYKFLQINPAFEKITGVKVTDLLGKTLKDIMPDTENYKIETFNEVATTGKSIKYENYISEIDKYFDAYAFSHKKGQFAIVFNDITERKKSEESLKESEERFRSLIEQAADAIYLVNLKGEIINVNIQACNQLGYIKKELQKKTIMDLDSEHPKLENVQNTWNNLTYGDLVTVKRKHVRKDGTIIPVEIRASVIKVNGKKHILRFVRDISDREIVEKISNAHLSLLEYSNNCTLNEFLVKTLDEAEKITESKIGFFHFVASDQETLKLLAYSTNTLSNMCNTQIEDKYYKISDASIWSECIHKKKPVIHNNYRELKHKKGLPEGHAEIIRELLVPVFRRGKIVAIIGVGNKYSNYNKMDIRMIEQLSDYAWDIVVKIKTEQALKESEEKFRNIFNSSTDGILIIDKNHKILTYNKTLLNLFGYKADQVKNKKATDFLFPKDVHIIQERLNQLLKNECILPIELQAINTSKRTIPIEINSKIIEYENQKAVLTIIRDISERKEAERKILNAIIETEEKERSRIAKDLHDGVSPIMSAIKLYVQSLKDSKEKSINNVLFKKINNTINEAVSSLNEISNNLSPHILQNFGLKSAIESFSIKISELKKLKIFLDFSINERFDKNIEIAFYRITTELINNTLKHANALKIDIKCFMKGNLIHLNYRDNGQGFDIENLLENKKEMGIFNIKNRVATLNGNIEITSQPNHGMSVKISIPINS